MAAEIDIKKIQQENTELYNEANRLSAKGLPDLTGTLPEDENEVTQDYLTAARRNAVAPIAMPKAANSDTE